MNRDDIQKMASLYSGKAQEAFYAAIDFIMSNSMEGQIIDDGGEVSLIVPALPTITHKMDNGDKVQVIIIEL